ncbi:NAD-dependent epimerase/dehydratase family protein [Haloarchaeobius iranensis]|uniref:Nucleoside-diphosphate-sugar epimerase n=1 Tax=Haloarchaeobius iranensis TaxID=996166 RepID=A0A1G9YM54_9EURY|nr:NAD(P)-dependent oxidoreductase [Haloarchaeobius iranensis]SDN09573.1 Nucleoside-diphosphate-sugar epimerase [Haloarchaeobius iranensis]
MQVFIAGATGVLGRRLVALCSARGHEVVGLTRDDAGAELVRESGGDPRRGDVLDRESVVEAASGADVLVHAATEIPTDTNPSEEEWALNDRVRRVGAENLVAAAAEYDADRVVLQSVVWVARQPDGSQFDEESEPHPDRSTRSALAAERIVRDGADEHGYEPVVLRDGYFYAADTAHTKLFGERLADRRLPIIAGGLLGRADAELSFVHVDDAARAFAAAVDGDATGTFHVVDDRPTTYAEFLRGFADRLDAPKPRRVPAWLAGLAIDDNMRRLLTRPMPTSNARFRQAFDWEPEYPTVEQGLDRVVAEWQQTGEVLDRGSR